MSCYHPRTLLYTCNDLGEVSVQFLGKEYYKDDFGKKAVEEGFGIYSIPVPCGQCLGCKLDYSRSWADRMTLEYDHTGKAVFLTLTYNDEHLKDPDGVLCSESLDFEHASLNKRDIQLFMKRLREKFPRLFPAEGYPKAGLRFYCVGEYGPKGHRPHYHLIIFGLEFSDFVDEKKNKNIYYVCSNELGQPCYTSDILQDLWSDDKNDPIGFVGISEVSYKTFAYVARYTLKKVFEDLSANERGQLSEWALMSRMPGLGAFFVSEHPDEFFSEDGHLRRFINPFSKKKSDRTKEYPKYIISKLEKVNPSLYNKIKVERMELAQDSFLQELQQTDKDPYDYLNLKEMEKRQKVEVLKKRKDL